MHITFNPPFMPIHTALLALTVAGVALALYLRRELAVRTPKRLLLASLRIIFMAILAVILMNPVSTNTHQQTQGRQPFLLLIDGSRSMSTDDAGGDTRWNTVLRATVQNSLLMHDLAARYDLHVYQFDDRPQATSPQALASTAKPTGDRTNIGAAIADTINASGAQNGAQVLLASDGHDTSDSFPLDAARAAKSRGITISTMCVGRQIERHDLRVIARKAQVYAAPNQTVQLAAEVRDSGIARTTVHATLMRDGRAAATQEVIVEPGVRDIEFPVTEHDPGIRRYSIKVSAAPGETDTANNSATIFLNVTKLKSRVLFLEGNPTWDSKFLAQTLRADPTVSIDVIYKLTDNRYFAVINDEQSNQTITVPRTIEQMSRYDVILFGKGFDEFYNDGEAQVLKRWVAERGGNVLFTRGRCDTNIPALRDLEPVVWTDQQIDELRIQLTQEGKSNPGFTFSAPDDPQTVVQKLPPLISATRVQGEKALAVILARSVNATDDTNAKQMATIAYQRYGQGKSMAIVGQGLWRWAFLPPDLAPYSRSYAEFWSQTIRWLVSDSDFLPGQSISIRTDHTNYGLGETVNVLGFQRNGRNAPPSTIIVTQPNGKTVRLAPAKSDGKLADFMASFHPTLQGEYVASLPDSADGSRNIACVFTVSAGHEEDQDRSSEPDLMRQIAECTGGLNVTPNETGQMIERLRTAELARQSKSETNTAWDRPWVLALLSGLLTCEWWLRRRGGLS